MKMTSPFKNLSKKVKEIIVDGDKIKVKPKVEDAQSLFAMKRELTKEDTKEMSRIMKEMIQRANPEEAPADIEAYVAEHFGSLVTEMLIMYRLTTRARLKKLIETEEKK